MSYRSRSITTIFVTIIFGMVLINSTFADEIRCSDVKYNNANYHENMEKLAVRSGLPDNYYNKYHQGVVNQLCSGDTKGISELIDNGFVKANEVEAIAKVLGKTYKFTRERSETGKSYGSSKETFLNMGLCNACADNVAQYYSRKPDSPCGRLAKEALEGNSDAIKKLVEFPDYCVWKY
jgi:hypothetical protein